MSELASKLSGATLPAFVMSTGAIGVPLPMEKVTEGITNAAAALGEYENSFWDATKGILQADVVPKVRSARLFLPATDGTQTEVKFLGFIKGAGMIQPNMATMLCIILTDLAIERSTWQDILGDAVRTTFNRMSLDGDMSPNDTVVALANGLAQNTVINDKSGPEYIKVKDEINQMCKELATSLIRDAGGTDITVLVRRALSVEDAAAVGRAISNSTQFKV
jgi:glutamate N-acetyltransferase/amino-acid N-acetyltransferase